MIIADSPCLRAIALVAQLILALANCQSIGDLRFEIEPSDVG
ncbi:hypothetical protein [Microcoleus vaginatus]